MADAALEPRFRRLFGPEPQGDVDDELSFHVEMRMRELIEHGESPERARELALRRFGDYDSSAPGMRGDRRTTGAAIWHEWNYLTELRQDVGYALAHAAPHARRSRPSPLATLALGIGANSAIFSVVHGVLLESLPFRDAERLYHVHDGLSRRDAVLSLSAPDFMSVREENRVFDQVEAFSTRRLHPARRRRAARDPRHERERRTVRAARASGRARPGVPARGEPARTRQRRRARPRILAARVRRRSERAGPQHHRRRRALHDRRRARAGRAAARRGGHYRAPRVRPDVQRDDGARAAVASSSTSIGRAKPGVDAAQDHGRSEADWHAAADRVSANERRR